MDELSDALYELALTNLHRVASMCVSPSGLACWALELLEEQACQVILQPAYSCSLQISILKDLQSNDI